MNNCNTQRNWCFTILGMLCLVVSGCNTTKFSANPKSESSQPQTITLREGDSVKILFPGSPDLNTITKIRRDGKITLPVVGEVQAAGMTSGELEKDLLTRYADQIVSKEINVILESSTFYVFLTGAVMRPGKIISDHPITALEAILEAGGVDYSRANLKNVIISRKSKGQMEHFKVDLKSVISGQSNETFYLQPNDILFIPEKFSWF